MQAGFGHPELRDAPLGRRGVHRACARLVVVALLVATVVAAAPAHGADPEPATAIETATNPTDDSIDDTTTTETETSTSGESGAELAVQPDVPTNDSGVTAADLAVEPDAPTNGTGVTAADIGPIAIEVATQLTGVVIDDLGQPAEGICIGVQAEDEQFLGSGTTGPDGRYTTTAMAPGSWALWFFDCRDPATLVSTVWTGTGGISWDPADASRIEIDGSVALLGDFDQALPRGTNLSGTVTSVAGPVADACVFAITPAEGEDGWTGVAGASTGPDGSYLLSLIPPGTVRIGASRCDSDLPILDGIYSASSPVLVRDPADGTPFALDPDTPITGLELVAELGTTLSGNVTASGSPVANVCVSTLDPTTGRADMVETEGDGVWSIVVGPGSYLAQATDCDEGRGLAGSFYDGTIAPAAADAIATLGGEELSGIDFVMTPSGPVTIRGRIVTGTGGTPEACAVVLLPEGEIEWVGATDPDGYFEVIVSPGAYIVGIASCDLDEDIPPPIVDPDDPNVTYPVQWWTGVPVDFTNPWPGPTWVVAHAGSGADLGELCLSPCTPPPATVPPPSPPTTTPPPVGTAPRVGSDPTMGLSSLPTPRLPTSPDAVPVAARIVEDDAGTIDVGQQVAPVATDRATRTDDKPTNAIAWLIVVLIILAAGAAMLLGWRANQRTT